MFNLNTHSTCILYLYKYTVNENTFDLFVGLPLFALPSYVL